MKKIIHFFCTCLIIGLSACSKGEPEHTFKVPVAGGFTKTVRISFTPVTDQEIEQETGLTELSTSGQRAHIILSANLQELKISPSSVTIRNVRVESIEGTSWPAPYGNSDNGESIRLEKTAKEEYRTVFEAKKVYFPHTEDIEARLSFELVFHHPEGDTNTSYRNLKLLARPSDPDSLRAQWINFASIFGFYR